MFPFTSVIEVAVGSFFLIIVFLMFVFLMLLAGSAQKKRGFAPPDEVKPDAEKESEAEEIEEIPIYEKYPEIYRFEILYWRGVSKPWWWNNYAKDLVDYAGEYFPWNKVDYYCTYNSNSVGEDYNHPSYHDRIVSLRPHKRSKHPLVVINYSEEYIMIDSHAALEEMQDRIDAEWYRHYKFKKTYRHSPISYTK